MQEPRVQMKCYVLPSGPSQRWKGLIPLPSVAFGFPFSQRLCGIGAALTHFKGARRDLQNIPFPWGTGLQNHSANLKTASETSGTQNSRWHTCYILLQKRILIVDEKMRPHKRNCVFISEHRVFTPETCNYRRKRNGPAIRRERLPAEPRPLSASASPARRSAERSSSCH